MKKMSKDRVLFNVIGYLFITLLAVACVLPFIMVISGSLTAEESIIQKGYSVFPREFSLNAYRLALKAPEKILRAYGVTTFVTVVGTFLGLLITSMKGLFLEKQVCILFLLYNAFLRRPCTMVCFDGKVSAPEEFYCRCDPSRDAERVQHSHYAELYERCRCVFN